MFGKQTLNVVLSQQGNRKSCTCAQTLMLDWPIEGKRAVCVQVIDVLCVLFAIPLLLAAA